MQKASFFPANKGGKKKKIIFYFNEKRCFVLQVFCNYFVAEIKEAFGRPPLTGGKKSEKKHPQVTGAVWIR